MAWTLSRPLCPVESPSAWLRLAGSSRPLLWCVLCLCCRMAACGHACPVARFTLSKSHGLLMEVALKKDGMGLLSDVHPHSEKDGPQDLLANKRVSARGPAAWLWHGVCSGASLDLRGQGRTSQVGWAPAQKAESRKTQAEGGLLPGKPLPGPESQQTAPFSEEQGKKKTRLPCVRSHCCSTHKGDFLEVGKE